MINDRYSLAHRLTLMTRRNDEYSDAPNVTRDATLGNIFAESVIHRRSRKHCFPLFLRRRLRYGMRIEVTAIAAA